ncbi:MAG: M28 family peptidase [Planctomycetes bacterium]|nr:M28 family peptidase [Planctomycetota bacterium]
MRPCPVPCPRLRPLAVAALAWTAPAFAGGREPTAEERRAAGAIHEGALRAHTRFLADDLLEGRGPGSRGDLLAQKYVAGQLEALGLKPGAPGGGWLQPVPLLGVDARVPPVLAFRRGEESLELKLREDFTASSGAGRRRAGFSDAELVFAGYGIRAPEHGWDDFKGAALRGKILVVMNDDPSSSPDLFAGATRLYYGRWDYKYEEAARQGAAGAIIIHTTPSAGYPWQVVQTSWTGEQFELRDGDGPRLEMRAWVTEEGARRIARLGGRDLDGLRRAAEGRDFRPVPLGVRFSVDLPVVAREVESANVLGLLEGSDPRLRREAVVFTAHHDHLGVETGEGAAAGEDRIYNGGVDNASGVAALLAIAAAFARLPGPPPRSVLFAAVAAEEQGLLGSEHLAAHPPVPRGRLAAVLNIDGVNIFGRTRDVTVVGHGKSTLDGLVEAVAALQGRRVVPDQFPDRGFYYRSDQFSFAKVGVPGVYLDSGTDFIGRPPGWGKERLEEWERTRYHQPSDEYEEGWDLSGAIEDAQLLFHVGLRAARAPRMPEWRPGDEFEAARKAALEEVGGE